MLRNRAVILANVEVTYGVDIVPTPAANAILCELPEFSVIGSRLERPNIQSYMGKLSPLNIGEGLKIKFVTELKGHGSVVDTPPEIGVLFRGCNFTETITPTTGPVDYDPNSAAGIPDSSESLSIYFYQDGILHKLLGSRGTFSVALKAGEYGKITWEFTGIYAGPADDTLPTGTFNTTLPPRFVSASFAIDSYAAVIESLNIDIANRIVKRPSANAATGILEWLISDREPKGDCDPEVVALATKDFWDMWNQSSQVALAATVGAVSMNRCVITGPKIVLDVPTYGDRENFLTHGLPMSLHPSSGNDEIKFSFT